MTSDRAALVEKELATLRAEVERLQAALDVVRASGLLIGSTTLHDRVRAVVHAALAEEPSIDLIRAETLEAAARVADDYEGKGMDGGYDSHLEDAFRTRREIAAAIRALKGIEQ